MEEEDDDADGDGLHAAAVVQLHPDAEQIQPAIILIILMGQQETYISQT